MAQFSPNSDSAPDLEAVSAEVCAPLTHDPVGDLDGEDADLVVFLQRYQPVVPTAATDLEDRLMAAIVAIPLATELARPIPVQHNPVRRKRLKPLKPLLGIGIGTLMAGIGWGIGQYLWPQNPLPAGQMAYVETFLLSSWDEALAEELDPAGLFHPEASHSEF
jgi:hypothetical protein